MSDPLDRFTPYARNILQYSKLAAFQFWHDYIGPEHVLLGLMHDRDSMAAFILKESGTTLREFVNVARMAIPRGDKVPPPRPALSRTAKLMVEFAVDEARRMGHHRITTAHMLIALIRLKEGIPFDVLKTFGIDLQKARALTLRAMQEFASSEVHYVPTSAPIDDNTLDNR